MDETSKRPWHLFLVRAVSVTLTVILAVGVVAIETDMAKGPRGWQQAQNPDGSFFLDTTPAVQRVAKRLGKTFPLALLVAACCATYAVFRNTPEKRRRTLWVALGLLLVSMACLAGNNVLSARSGL
jgi:hypothetical protein